MNRKQNKNIRTLVDKAFEDIQTSIVNISF